MKRERKEKIAYWEKKELIMNERNVFHQIASSLGMQPQWWVKNRKNDFPEGAPGKWENDFD